MPELRTLRRWDVVCRVVDHYGDAGVCLRIARALAAGAGRDVRLLADRPDVLLALVQPLPAATYGVDEAAPPAADATPAGGPRGHTRCDRSGVVIAGWDAPAREVDIVLETFGGGLPPALLGDLQRRKAAGHPIPVWLNLEYLSAEDWVEGCHGMPSPQAGGLTRWFLFPGFSSHTAGLPGPPARLPPLPADLAALLRGTAAASAGNSVASLGNPALPADPMLTGSVFCYSDSPLPALLDAMQRGPREVRLLVPVGMPGDLGGRTLGDATGSTWQGGRLTLVRTPFVDQDVYDSVLATCDFNIVRGEDSFVRSQWAARPLLWAAYPQEAEAHRAKVEAWLARCAMPGPWATLNRWFNGETVTTPPERLWRDAADGVDTARTWSTGWREALAMLPRVDEAIAEFALRHA